MTIREGILVEVKKREGFNLFLMNPKILSWNVRGLNERDNRLRLGVFYGIGDIVCLQETK
jgi:predicted membrane GTPase involved in stress response